MANQVHAVVCPNCKGTVFHEEKLVEIDSSVVVRDKLPVPAQAIRVEYRYVCINCKEILTHEWSGHHES